jgi:hypothetical protein
MIENFNDKKIMKLKSDNGGEYTSDLFMKLCKFEGIERHLTIRETPWQNSVVEHLNHTILEKV